MLSQSGRISDVLSSYLLRSSGTAIPLKVVLAARRYRIELMFTTLGIGLGKLALPVIVARAVIRRNHLELLALPLFFCALVPVPGLQGGGRRSHLLAALLRPLLRAGDRRAGGVGLRADGVGLGAPRAARARARRAGRALGGAGVAGAAGRLRPQGWPVAAAPGARDRRALRRGEHGHRSRQGGGAALVPGPLSADGGDRLSRRHSRRLGAAVGAAAAPVGRQSAGRGRGRRQHARLHHGHAERVARRAACRRRGTTTSTRSAFSGCSIGRSAPRRSTGTSSTSASRRSGSGWWLGPTEPIRSVRPNAWTTWEWRKMLGQPAVAPTSRAHHDRRAADRAQRRRRSRRRGVGGPAAGGAGGAPRRAPDRRVRGGDVAHRGRSPDRRAPQLHPLLRGGEHRRRRPLLRARQGERAAPPLGAAGGAGESGDRGGPGPGRPASGAGARSTAWKRSIESDPGRSSSPASGARGRAGSTPPRRSRSRDSRRRAFDRRRRC